MEALAAVTKDCKWQKTGHGEDGEGKGKDGKGKDGKFKDGKGKGKRKKGAKAESQDRFGNTLVSSTPDGRELCFAFHAQGCSGKCGRVHACRVKGCYGQHAASEHAKYSKGSDTPAAHQQS